MATLSPWHGHFLQLARYNAWATQRLLDAIAQPHRQAQRGRSGQGHGDHCAVHRAQQRTGGTEAINQMAEAWDQGHDFQQGRRSVME